MKIESYWSTGEILAEIGRRVSAARIEAALTQPDVAAFTGLSIKTISNLECGKDVNLSTLIAVLRCLGQLQGLESAIPEPGIRPSVLLALKGKQPERVGKRMKEQVSKNSAWKWGDEE